MDTFITSTEYAEIVADASIQQWHDFVGGLLFTAMFVAGLLLIED